MIPNSSINGVLVDLSGTLHVEDLATPNAVQALNKLRRLKMKIKFVTNTTKESGRILYERLTKLGFVLSPDEIFSSLSSARELIKREKLRPMLMVEDAALEEFAGLYEFDGPPDSVVVGLSPSKFNRTDLNQALRVLMGGARLIAIHEGRYYKTSSGMSMGPGPFVKLLEYASGVKATVVGKPNPAFFQAALDSLGIDDPTTTLVIGDDVRDDIGGARTLGMKGFLVKTGKYREGDENEISPPPFRLVENFAQAVDEIMSVSDYQELDS